MKSGARCRAKHTARGLHDPACASSGVLHSVPKHEITPLALRHLACLIAYSQAEPLQRWCLRRSADGVGRRVLLVVSLWGDRSVASIG